MNLLFSMHTGGIVKIVPVLFVIIAGLFITSAPEAEDLSTPQRNVRDALLNSYVVNDCCGCILRRCLDGKQHCSIADHLENYLTWFVERDPDPDPVKVREQIDLRYNGFVTDKVHAYDTEHLQVTGNPNAPVVVTAYVSAYCPSCKQHVADLRNAVLSDGALQKHAALYVKPVGKGIGNVALLAAAEEGKFWELFFAYRRMNTVLKDTSDIIAVAANAGVLSERFVQLLSDPVLHQRLKENLEESRNNDVKYYPAYFINGKKYSSSLKTRWVIDAIECEYERLGKQ